MALPNPLDMFPPSERARVQHTSVAHALLTESKEADDYVVEHFQTIVDAPDLATMAAPDTSRNPAIAIAHHVSTPGHYGVQPRIFGPDADRTTPLLEQLWPMKQHVEFLAWGLGSAFVRTDWSEDLDRVVHTIVLPQHVWTIGHRHDPRLAVVVRQLTVQRVKLPGQAEEDRYAWEEFDVRDPSIPSYRLVEARRNGELGDDWTERVLGIAPTGDAYPYRYDDGTPFIPFDVHRSRDTGTMFSWELRKGLFRGVLNTMFIATCALSAAYGATGKSHILSGLTIPGVKTTRDGAGNTIARLPLRPGEAVFGTHEAGVSPFGYSMDAGDNLSALAAFEQQYASWLALDTGVTPTDATRVGANPMSGTALHMTNAMKREMQREMQPLARAADMGTIRKSIALWNAKRDATAPAIDAASISIQYTEIAKSPDEERQHREALQWRVENGMMSPIDMYLELNPGMTREAAAVELRRIATETQETKVSAVAAPAAQ